MPDKPRVSRCRLVMKSRITGGQNVGVVGQGSLLYIRTDTVPSTLKVAVDKANNQYCTITFKQTIDEEQTYVCR
ncbi:hypothetical protein LRM35_16640 [Klebsiella variicola subsp. variicola]|nr:hypothetical protein LRM35_16640 [Klebsiella variicola subsp. variicola]